MTVLGDALKALAILFTAITVMCIAAEPPPTPKKVIYYAVVANPQQWPLWEQHQ